MKDLEQPNIGVRPRTQWKNWIMMSLGAPVVKVELTESQVDSSIDSAIKIFSAWAPWEHIGGFTTIPGEAEYDLSKIIPGFIEVRDVLYSPSQAEAILQGFFSDFIFVGITVRMRQWQIIAY